ncbi:hypothetical protein KI387_026445, partial [Taxus chinensis]
YAAALDSLKKNDGLIVCLQLKNCQINDERLSDLFLAMEHSEMVTSIDLSDNLITDDGALFLSTLLRGGAIQSLIYLDVRGNLITSRAHELFDEIRHVRKILKVQSAIKILKSDGTLDTSRLAVILKEISLLVSEDLSLQWQNGISRPGQIEHSEGIKCLVGNLQSFISILDLKLSRGNMGDRGAGLHRIALVELLCVVILHCWPLVEEDILSSCVLAKMLKLFGDFPQNSILHCTVFRCLQAILSGSSKTLFWYLVKDASLPYFLAREGTKCSALHQGRRPSYSGHIFVLSKTLKDLEENDEDLK